ncbi:MAG: hypothetical protein EA390_04400, partial [Balneolaceae bacterium]
MNKSDKIHQSYATREITGLKTGGRASTYFTGMCLMLAIALIAIACDSSTQPHDTESDLRSMASVETSSVISDGANEGTEGFFFLPPMVMNPDYTGTFDAELSPVVEICETITCEAIHASFSMTEGEGSELVRMEADDEHYIVNWHTGHTDAEAGETYHLRVRANDLVLGYADVAVVSTGRDAVS